MSRRIIPPAPPGTDPCAALPGRAVYSRKPNLPAEPPGPASFPAPEPKNITCTAREGDLVVLHSPHDRCGIREYGRQLDAELAKLVRQVHACAVHDTVTLERPAKVPVLVHWEPGLAPVNFLGTLDNLRAMGARIVLCCHRHTGREPSAHAYVVHRPAGIGTIEIPLGCPVYEPKETRGEIRGRLGFPSDAVVLTTLGFLSQWKRIPDILAALLPLAERNWIVCVQTPWPYTGLDAAREQEKSAREVIGRFPNVKVKFSTDFMSESDLLDLVHASDVGFVFHGAHTQSVSAATKQFVSARTPLVVTGSTHASDMVLGVRRVEGLEPPSLAYEVANLAKDRLLQEALRADLENEYQRINMRTVAAKYLDLFRSLGCPSM